MPTGMKDIALCFERGALVESVPLWLYSLAEDRSKTQLRVSLIETTKGRLPMAHPLTPILLFPKGRRRGGVGCRRAGVYVTSPHRLEGETSRWEHACVIDS